MLLPLFVPVKRPLDLATSLIGSEHMLLLLEHSLFSIRRTTTRTLTVADCRSVLPRNHSSFRTESTDVPRRDLNPHLFLMRFNVYIVLYIDYRAGLLHIVNSCDGQKQPRSIFIIIILITNVVEVYVSFICSLFILPTRKLSVVSSMKHDDQHLCQADPSRAILVHEPHRRSSSPMGRTSPWRAVHLHENWPLVDTYNTHQNGVLLFSTET